MTAAGQHITGGHSADMCRTPVLEAHRYDRLLVTVEEAAHLLHVHRSTVYDLLGTGELSSVRIGRRRLIARQTLVEFVDRKEDDGRS